ncbi:hypothetical protein D9756_009770 [Leucocoprinus leucothites]|uniref:Yeast cell wall synthesis Kre9/Knh1-like N-terminal domain-containing protein n=1 Tax=Leucocoprinus leucothites TaxID=201217 RepID=A0A8H5CWF5_9AGAR|nr:hypothetical protein D9756_009770 [Leucoagaricus leucothites]
MLSKSLAALALAVSPALATVFLTSPTASTTFHGGQPATINWQDDGSVPSLEQFGNARVSIYVGNAQQQTSLQTIVDSVNVATTSSVQFTPNPQIGPNGNDYFIRIESLAFKDPKNPQFPALSFSAKFTMDNMSGTFNSTIQAQIAGQSTAPLAGGQSTPGSPSATKASLTTTRSTTASTSGVASPSSSSAALHSKVGWTGIIISALIGVAAF